VHFWLTVSGWSLAAFVDQILEADADDASEGITDVLTNDVHFEQEGFRAVDGESEKLRLRRAVVTRQA
jgi:hypothetical protein